MSRLFFYFIVIASVYTIIPTFIIRLFGIGVYKKGLADRSIALTFDDGPDPEYTPRLLDLLKNYDIKATFFVLGSKAERYPDLITRMHGEGHLVGVHNYGHQTNAFMTPRKVRAQLQEAVHAIESIINIRPVYYRPPWGVINLFDFFLLKQFHMVLWSIIVGDWRSFGGKQKIKQRLLSKLRDGAVIVLHDSGETLGADRDAPIYMLEALSEFLDEAMEKGYRFVRIDNAHFLGGFDRGFVWSKRFFISLWFKWDALFHKLFGIKVIDPENPVLYYKIRTYHGQTLTLSDGQTIKNGDRVVELHFNNKQLLKLSMNCTSMVQLAVQIIRLMKDVMPKITGILANQPVSAPIKGVYGITMIHKGSGQLGFTSTELSKGWFSFVTRMYLKLLLAVIHPEGAKRLRVKSKALIPKILAMSEQEIKSRFPLPSLGLSHQKIPIEQDYSIKGH